MFKCALANIEKFTQSTFSCGQNLGFLGERLKSLKNYVRTTPHFQGNKKTKPMLPLENYYYIFPLTALKCYLHFIATNSLVGMILIYNELDICFRDQEPCDRWSSIGFESTVVFYRSWLPDSILCFQNL